MTNPKRVIVVENRRCIELAQEANGFYGHGDYEAMPPEIGGGNFMLTNGESVWESPVPAFTSESDIYFTLFRNAFMAKPVVRNGSKDTRDQFYRFVCEGSRSLSKRLSVEMSRLYADMDKMEIKLPPTEACMQTYQERLTIAEGLAAAAQLGQLDFIQRLLKLSDANFNEASVIKGFRAYLQPPICHDGTTVPSPGQTVTQKSTPSPIANKTGSSDAILLARMQEAMGNISLVSVVNNAKERAEARSRGEEVSPTSAKISGTPRILPIDSTYTSWVAFTASMANPHGDINGVAQRLVDTITHAASGQNLAVLQFRVVLITQRASDTTSAAVNMAATDIQRAGITVTTLHQSKPVFRVEDILAHGRNRMTSNLEKFANAIVIAVLPAKAPSSPTDILGYYAEFLNRQEDGLMIGSDVGSRIKTHEF